MSFRRVVYTVVTVCVVVVLAGLAWVWRPAISPISANAKPAFDRKAINRGAELALIGNCSDCHTKEGGAAYAGGRSIPTPFGTIYASNLTPDPDTGIGTWSEEAFGRAMHEGVDREGRQLYPAFPYDHFTHATKDDIHALYAYFMSLTPVRSTIPANELNFPFNYRPLVAGWKLLFLSRGNLAPDASKSADWNRGRYLVEGLGHCGSCHTPRNALGGEKKDSAYTGGVAEGWNAPPLNASLVAGHHWTVDQLAEYLSSGWHQLHGAAAGPMADVTKNLGQASKEDVHAMAVYIASLSGAGNETPKASPALVDAGNAANARPEIVAIYNGACAKCHNDRNTVGPSKALPLSLSTAIHQPEATNTVQVILNGIQSYRADGGPYMPAFDGMLTDDQIAALAQYVRTRYSGQPPWTDVRAMIAKARQQGAQP
ncbi:c-type cytochrome [Bradyrhizobium sp. SYSU BS000235]|uniref:c-type cytochrome n=1 Tax=Bradyrhizobium sp. SYSU BS000235 TaxID=3411332 RepID=UPI003C751B31